MKVRKKLIIVFIVTYLLLGLLYYQHTKPNFALIVSENKQFQAASNMFFTLPETQRTMYKLLNQNNSQDKLDSKKVVVPHIKQEIAK